MYLHRDTDRRLSEAGLTSHSLIEFIRASLAIILFTGVSSTVAS